MKKRFCVNEVAVPVWVVKIMFTVSILKSFLSDFQHNEFFFIKKTEKTATKSAYFSSYRYRKILLNE